MQTATEFWDGVFAHGGASDYSRVEMPNLDDAILKTALEHFGDVRGKTLVDLGCGRGATSLFFAHHGADVIALDTSTQAIGNLAAYCEANRVANLEPRVLSALDLDRLGEADFVFGSMILHHLEPFAVFAGRLRQTLRPDGKAFFWENNARSRALLWCRENVIGKLWIPKYGDADEFPLTPREVDELRRHFDVHVEYPELLLFRMIPRYLFRGRMMRPFEALDRFFYRVPAIRQYSYRQFVRLS
jgi:SAM-dependent methyltransferase